jgi:hypothetical protein
MQLGYNPEPALRLALRDLGYDPDYLLVKQEQAEPGGVPGGPQGGGGSPMTSDVMAAMGGPGLPSEMQGRGDIGI